MSPRKAIADDNVISLQHAVPTSGFTPAQIEMLSDKLDSANVKKNNKDLDYIEGWKTIDEANRIFGFDGWNREIMSLVMVAEPYLTGNNYRVGYRATVRVTVYAGDRVIYRDGTGYGSGIVKDLNDAHEKAVKEAETDAMKRALMTFGNQFGLALYDKAKENVLTPEEKAAEEAAAFAADLENRLAVEVQAISSLADLDALYEKETWGIKRVGSFDKAKRNAIIALFTKRKNELAALQPKVEEQVEVSSVSPVSPAAPAQEPQVSAEAAAPDAASSAEDFALPADLLVDFKKFGTPTDWPSWGKACLNAIRSITDEVTLDKWAAAHNATLERLDKIVVAGKRGKEPNLTDISGKEIVDFVVLEIERRYAQINGTSLTLKWADGTERNIFKDAEDWASGLERFANPVQMHNVAPNVDLARKLIAECIAEGKTVLADRISDVLSQAEKFEAARKAEREAA